MIEPSNTTRQASTDDRRAEIAAAARGLIVEKGLEGLRARDIAERVGINIATLHYHVPSRSCSTTTSSPTTTSCSVRW